jgi:hypothetical protein
LGEKAAFGVDYQEFVGAEKEPTVFVWYQLSMVLAAFQKQSGKLKSTTLPRMRNELRWLGLPVMILSSCWLSKACYVNFFCDLYRRIEIFFNSFASQLAWYIFGSLLSQFCLCKTRRKIAILESPSLMPDLGLCHKKKLYYTYREEVCRIDGKGDI